MDKSIIGLVVIVLVAVFGVGYIVTTGYFVNTQQTQGPYDSLAKCLTQKGVVMYGAYWCPHCTNQKNMFGSSFQDINYVECDQNGPSPQPQLCQENGITGYPTWIINGKQYRGEQTIQNLAEASGCQ